MQSIVLCKSRLFFFMFTIINYIIVWVYQQCNICRVANMVCFQQEVYNYAVLMWIFCSVRVSHQLWESSQPRCAFLQYYGRTIPFTAVATSLVAVLAPNLRLLPHPPVCWVLTFLKAILYFISVYKPALSIAVLCLLSHYMHYSSNVHVHWQD